jgi:ribosomal protein S18 acetylase RimI-like enzyme
MVDTTKSIAEKFRCYLMEHGVASTICWITGKVVKRFVCPRRSYLLERELVGELPSTRAEIDVDFRVASRRELRSFRHGERPLRQWFRQVEACFAKGQICIACFSGEEVIGYLWVSFVPEGDPNLGLDIRPGEKGSYAFDLFVLPQYRQFRIASDLIRRWLEYSRDVGKERGVIVVLATNAPMLKLMKRLGFVPVRQFFSLEFFGRRGLLLKTANV